MTTNSPDGHTAQLALEVNAVIPTQRNLETSVLVTNSVMPHQSLNISIDTSSLAGDTGGFLQPRPPLPPLNDDMYNTEDLMADNYIDTDACDNEMSDNTTSNLQCLMHLLKGNIGTGILAMPVAIYNAGLWTGFAGILLIGAMAVHCMHMLIRCSHILCRRTGSKSLSYADAMETCLKTGPQRLKKFARASRHLVNGLLLFTQLGFCSVYIVFIAENLQQIVQTMTSHDPNLRVYEVVVMVLLIPYTLLRNLRVLAPFSSFANLLTLTGLIIIFQYIVRGLEDSEKLPAFSDLSRLPLFFGTAIFAFEGISLVLPLEHSMRNPQDFGGWTGVLNLGMVFVTCLYTAVGFYGYLRFTDSVKGSITLNIPTDDWLYLSVKLMFAISIYVSYGIQLYVPIRIIWPSLEEKLHRDWQKKHGESLLRISFVILTAVFAVLIPHLDLLISLIGALASSSLAAILPAFIEFITLSVERGGVSPVVIAKDVFLFLVGLLGCVTGTYASVQAIVKTLIKGTRVNKARSAKDMKTVVTKSSAGILICIDYKVLALLFNVNQSPL